MNSKKYFNTYFSIIKNSINSIDPSELGEISNLIMQASKLRKKIIIVGNGGSASIASHLTIDLINVAKIKSMNFNETSMITCFSNDYGYENWIVKALDCYANNGDVAIFISSSGQSMNIINGLNKAKEIGLSTITLSGFLKDNPLSSMGDINLWVDSKEYNVVELTHQIWLLSIVDYIIMKTKDYRK